MCIRDRLWRARRASGSTTLIRSLCPHCSQWRAMTLRSLSCSVLRLRVPSPPSTPSAEPASPRSASTRLSTALS
eukprot:12303352-Alexandrium_andersonii.AAC.1